MTCLLVPMQHELREALGFVLSLNLVQVQQGLRQLTFQVDGQVVKDERVTHRTQTPFNFFDDGLLAASTAGALGWAGSLAPKPTMTFHNARAASYTAELGMMCDRPCPGGRDHEIVLTRPCTCALSAESCNSSFQEDSPLIGQGTPRIRSQSQSP